MRAIPNDTDPAAREVQLRGWRIMSSARKAALVDAISRDCTALAITGIRERHPGSSDREVLLRLGVLRYGPELMRSAFGWDAATRGL